METGIEKMEDDKQMLNLNAVDNFVSKNSRCNELEDSSKKVEVRCAELEFELQKKREQCEALEAKFKALEVENSAVKDELKVFKMSSEGLKGKEKVSNEKEREVETIVDLTEDNEVVQLMIESKVLGCEKKKAESEVEVWKDKYKKLESWASQLGLGRGSYCHEENKKKEAGNPINDEGNSHLDLIMDSKEYPARKARKQLAFKAEESNCKKMAPSTPNGEKSAVNVIDIIDSDEEPNISQHPVQDSQSGRNVSLSTCFAAKNLKISENSNAQNIEENLNLGENIPFVATPKRKRTCNVVTSGSEHDDVPICISKRMHIQKLGPDQVRVDTNNSVPAAISVDDKVAITATPRQRLLLPLRKYARKSQEDKKRSSYRSNKAKHHQSIPTNYDDDESEDLSDCEDEGLSDFIVDDSDVSNCEDAPSKSQAVSDGVEDSGSCNSQDVSDNDSDSDSQDVSDGDMDFGKILSQIQRRKDHNMEWEYEADMLAAFGKDPELCMKAVCALYRRQTYEEQFNMGTLYCNQQGFNKFDAHRGSTVAEFLTSGDPRGGITKSVKELQEYDAKAVVLCRTLAIRYSKQLFEIYKNKEDPLFR